MIPFLDPPRLPTIDLSLFDIGDPWRDHVAAQVDWAASTFGLFQILGHGVDPVLIDTLLDLGGKYIALEERANARSAEQVADLPGFYDAVGEYTTTMTGLGHKLMTAMARGLRLDDSFFVDRYSGNPVTSLRIREYPVAGRPVASRPAVAIPALRTKLTGIPGAGVPTAGAPATSTRVDAAADRGLLTIVKLGESEGQQVFLDGQWIDVPALPSALLCYVGPVLERLTQGHYVSAAHRLSPGDARTRPSLSFAFEPGSDAVLPPVANVRPRLGSAAYLAAMPWRPAADSSRRRPG
ncbi:MAG TPA: 2OG-Fe(II) oxygenase family protein [Steroidobacteraceae bacterium]|nr:2OG-Fe(II) oxygenase family protein [Steroidobacteraceae bacterium]